MADDQDALLADFAKQNLKEKDDEGDEKEEKKYVPPPELPELPLSQNDDVSVKVSFKNCTQRRVNVYWCDYKGELVQYFSLKRGKSKCVDTFATHPWVARDKVTNEHMHLNGSQVFYPAEANDTVLVSITEPGGAPGPSPASSRSSSASLGSRSRSRSRSRSSSRSRSRSRSESPASKARRDALQAQVGDLPASKRSKRKVHVVFENRCACTVNLYWSNFDGVLVHYVRLSPGKKHPMLTYASHPWVAGAEDGDGEGADAVHIGGGPVYTPVEPADNTDRYLIPIHEPGDEENAELSLLPPRSDAPETQRIALPKSHKSKTKVKAKFVNVTDQDVGIFWSDLDGKLVHYAKVEPGGEYGVDTYAGHPWVTFASFSGQRVFMEGQPYWVPPKPSQDADPDHVITIHLHSQGDERHPAGPEPMEAPRLPKSKKSRKQVKVKFVNASDQDVDIYWSDFDGHLVHYASVEPGQDHSVSTYVSHPWAAFGVERRQQMFLEGQPYWSPPKPEKDADPDHVTTIKMHSGPTSQAKRPLGRSDDVDDKVDDKNDNHYKLT